ncbi:MAG: glycosyltransferase family 2 protein [Prevotella sp.]|nr:glycosyltransferase family 2 protein [Prevotella sp.]
MEKVLTVVVPVYKVEQYIDKCLTSLILPDEQMTQLEVLVVNDGTPDQSAIMAKTYEEKYPDTFRVIDKENGGHGSAWNRGVREAHGKYIKFLDSDDWYDNADFSTLVKRLTHCDADVVLCNINKHFVNRGTVEKVQLVNMKDGENYRIANYDWLGSGNDTELFDFWYATYRTSMLQAVQPLFVEKVFYDDAILFIAPVILGETFSFFDLTIYNYLIGRVGQTMNLSAQVAHAKDYIKVSTSMVDFAERHGYDEGYKKPFVCLRLNIYIRNTFIYLNALPKDQLKHIVKVSWLPYVKEHFPDYKESKVVKYYLTLPYWLYKRFFKWKIEKQHYRYS